jgi:hypothetical protein
VALNAAQLISRDALYPTRRSSVYEPAILPRRLTAVGGGECRSAYLRRDSNNKIQIDCNIRPLPEFVNVYFPEESRRAHKRSRAHRTHEQIEPRPTRGLLILIARLAVRD